MTLVVDNIAKSFRKRGVHKDVLRDVNAVFEPGRSVGILAPPKTGKSTLMKILAGVQRPSAGRIQRNSRVSFMVGTSVGRKGALPARDAVAFLARIYGARSREIIDFVADFGELGSVIDQPLDALSKDDKARLSYTLAYALPFDIYLADETVVGGPQSFQDRCADLVHERRKNSGLIFTTSKVRKLQGFADAGALLHEGELFFFPSVDEAIRTYEILNPLWRMYDLLPDPQDEPDDDEENDSSAGLF